MSRRLLSAVALVLGGFWWGCVGEDADTVTPQTGVDGGVVGASDAAGGGQADVSVIEGDAEGCGGFRRCGEVCVTAQTLPQNCGACGHNCGPAECKDDLCAAIPLASRGGILAIANYGDELFGTTVADNEIQAFKKADGALRVVKKVNPVGPIYVAAGRIAYGEGSTLRTMSTDGNNVMTLGPSVLNPIQTIAPGGVDTVYFATTTQVVGFKVVTGEETLRATIAGVSAIVSAGSPFVATPTSIIKLTSTGATDQTIPNQTGPTQLAADETTLYWTNGDPNQRGSLVKAKLTDLSTTTIDPELSSPHGLVLDERGIYVTDLGDGLRGRVLYYDKTTSTRTVLFEKENYRPNVLTSDAEWLYWFDPGVNTIMKLRKPAIATAPQ